MPVFQLKISKLRYIRIDEKQNEIIYIYIHNMFRLYKVYISIFPNNPPKKISALSVFKHLKTSLEKSFFRHLESLKVLRIRTELRRRRTPLPTRLRRLFPSRRVIGGPIDPRRLQVTFRTFHRDPLSIPRVSQGSVCICLVLN